jgi:hypothetical protein
MSKNLLSQAHMKAIGSLIAQTSKLESLLTDLISIFTRMDIVSALITVHHQQTSSKIDSLLALSRLRFGKDPQFQPIIDMFNTAKAIADFRNTIVHAAYWVIDDNGTAAAVRFTARGEFKRSRTPLTPEQIQERAAEAADLNQRFRSLRDEDH